MNAEQTRDAIQKAMGEYERSVLNPRYWNADKGIFQYPYRVSEAEVLRLAKIKSRSTLSADHHSDIKVELGNFITSLKERTGKSRKSAESKEVEAKGKTRMEQFAQTIAAQDYKIRALEQELESLKSNSSGKVTNMSGRKR